MSATHPHPRQRAWRRRVAVRGMPLRASRGWVVIAVVLAGISVDLLAPDDTGRLRPYLLTALIAAGSLASLVLHDLAHDLVARRRGARVLAIVLSSFGALTDEAYPPENPADDARVAAGGPAASAAVAVALGAGWWLAPDASFAADLLGTLATINGALALLTLLPGYPMDGGRILRAFLWYVSDDLIMATKAVALYGQIIGFGIILAGLLTLALGGAWSAAAAWLLFAYWAISQTAREGFARTLIREGGRRVTADEAGLAVSRRVAADRTIDAALDEILQSISSGPILVQRDGEVVGLVTLRDIQRVPRSEWDVYTVGDVASPLDGIPRTTHDAALVDILDLVDASAGHVALIVAGERIVGAVDAACPGAHPRSTSAQRGEPSRRDSSSRGRTIARTPLCTYTPAGRLSTIEPSSQIGLQPGLS